MSALAREHSPALALVPMDTSMLDAVTEIERAAYDFPWTRGNFLDSMSAGYTLRVLRAAPDRIVGYYVAMPGVSELHLLNLTVAPAAQRQGHARLMLEALRPLAASLHAHELWLEVRASNQRARAIYERFGFRNCGRRRDYYPARDAGREDAIVMSLSLLSEVAHGLE
ncbi:MAG: hypothetical protein RLZZ598_1605 [Pseudomonadota bacterium]|jgi:[ribosomal protein S18]-alanine N-acetyltransferase